MLSFATIVPVLRSEINDTIGHQQGDMSSQELAVVLHHQIGSTWIVSLCLLTSRPEIKSQYIIIIIIMRQSNACSCITGLREKGTHIIHHTRPVMYESVLEELNLADGD